MLNVTRHGIDIGRLYIGWSQQVSSERVHPDTFLTLSVTRWGTRGRVTGLSGSVAHRAWWISVMPPHPSWAEPWAKDASR